MPTTLPTRSRESTYGRKRGLPRAAVLVMLWAAAMMAIAATAPSRAAILDISAAVQP